MKRKVAIALGIIVLIVMIVLNYISSNDVVETSDSVVVAEERTESIDAKSDEVADNPNIKVDIKGAIAKPGVYEVNSDYRVIDVIKLAGGLKSNANTNYINLSSKVTDEMVIWIYTTKEISEFKLKQSSTQYMIEKCNCPVLDNTTCLNSNSNKNSNSSKEQNSYLNINTATLEELMTLDGIGESKAKSIIEYRTKNGTFKSIEDIMNVNGIGETVYNKIKDHIKV